MLFVTEFLLDFMLCHQYLYIFFDFQWIWFKNNLTEANYQSVAKTLWVSRESCSRWSQTPCCRNLPLDKGCSETTITEHKLGSGRLYRMPLSLSKVLWTLVYKYSSVQTHSYKPLCSIMVWDIFAWVCIFLSSFCLRENCYCLAKTLLALCV